jgi:hypothetical protein
MNRDDLAEQCREAYLAIDRNWLPIFYWILDTAVINA